MESDIERVLESVLSGSFSRSLINRKRAKRNEEIPFEREIEKLLTDFVVKQFFQTQESLYNFLAFVCNTFEDALAKYRQRRDIPENDIFFIHKGGNIIRFISREFWLELPRESSNKLGDYFMKYFGRSDADFSIYINPELPDFEKVFREVSELSFLVLGIIRKEFLSRPTDYLDIYKFNNEYLKLKLKKLLGKIGKINGTSYEHISLGKIRDDGEMNSLTKYDTITTGTLETEDLEKIEYTPVKSLMVNKLRKTIRLRRNMVLSVFALARTKIKFYLWKKNGREMDTIWGELIDVTIIHRDYHEIHDFFQNVRKHITTYQLSYEDKKLVFRSYTLQHLIEDLETIIFQENEFPWKEPKYEKRLNRLLYLYFVDVFIKIKSKEERISIFTDLKKGNEIQNREVAVSHFSSFLRGLRAKTENDKREMKILREKINESVDVIVNTIQGVRSYCQKEAKIDSLELYNTDSDILT